MVTHRDTASDRHADDRPEVSQPGHDPKQDAPGSDTQRAGSRPREVRRGAYDASSKTLKIVSNHGTTTVLDIKRIPADQLHAVAARGVLAYVLREPDVAAAFERLISGEAETSSPAGDLWREAIALALVDDAKARAQQSDDPALAVGIEEARRIVSRMDGKTVGRAKKRAEVAHRFAELSGQQRQPKQDLFSALRIERPKAA